MTVDTFAGKHALLSRIFDLVSNLGEHQQIALLKKLHRGRLASSLFKQIIDLSEDKQLDLLNQLKEMTDRSLPEKTIDLDERETPRKSCTIAVDYSTGGGRYSSLIRDISTAGVFIETDESLAVGQKLTLNFSFPETRETVELTGEIVWRSPRGIGVKFFETPFDQERKIRKFMGDE